MSATIPSEVETTVTLLRREAKQKYEEGNRLASEAQMLIRLAQHKARLADELEASFGIVHFRREAPPGSANGSGKAAGDVTIERIRDYLAHNGGRPNHVAKHFGVSEEQIKKLIAAPDSRVTVAERGWLKLNLL